MVATLVLASLALCTSVDTGLFHQLFPHPTGQNGYEEYAQAADVMAGSRFDVYDKWPKNTIHPPSPPGWPATSGAKENDLAILLSKKAEVEVRRMEVEEFGKALPLLHGGSSKPVSDPRPTLTSATLYPELMALKRLARFAAHASWLEFHEGRQEAGVRLFSDVLTMSHRTCGGSLINLLTSASCQQPVFDQLEATRTQWTLESAKQIEILANKMLAEKFPMREMLKREFQIAHSSLAKRPTTEVNDYDDDETKHLNARIKGLSEGEYKQYAAECLRIIAKSQDLTATQIEGDESGWIHPAVKRDPKQKFAHTPFGLAQESMAGETPMWEEIGVLLARIRTQYRLLRLHAKVVEYRQLHGQLPTKLSDAASLEELFDPVLKKPFCYELKTNGVYLLYSTGFGGHGKIDLKYTRPPVHFAP